MDEEPDPRGDRVDEKIGTYPGRYPKGASTRAATNCPCGGEEIRARRRWLAQTPANRQWPFPVLQSWRPMNGRNAAALRRRCGFGWLAGTRQAVLTPPRGDIIPRGGCFIAQRLSSYPWLQPDRLLAGATGDDAAATRRQAPSNSSGIGRMGIRTMQPAPRTASHPGSAVAHE